MTRLPQLDGVRGIAALVVLISHCANAGYLPATFGLGMGQMGVRLFFALSGFLMAHLYMGRPFNAAEVIRYGRHRAGRILPLYYGVILLALVVPDDSVVWLFPFEGHSFWKHLLLLQGRWTLWTIPVEVQFYIVFLLIWRIGKPWALAVVLLGAVVAAMILWPPRQPMLPLWIAPFLGGVGLEHLWRNGALERFKRMDWFGYLVPVLWVVAVPQVRLHWMPVLPVWIDPLTVGAPVVVFAAALLQLGPLRLLSGVWLRRLGDISYGIYLFHFPVLKTFKALAPDGGPVVVLGVLAVTILLATASYRWFERPLRRLVAGERAFPRPIPAS